LEILSALALTAAHNTGFVAAKRDAAYLPFLVQNLKEILQAIPEFGLRDSASRFRTSKNQYNISPNANPWPRKSPR